MRGIYALCNFKVSKATSNYIIIGLALHKLGKFFEAGMRYKANFGLYDFCAQKQYQMQKAGLNTFIYKVVHEKQYEIISYFNFTALLTFNCNFSLTHQSTIHYKINSRQALLIKTIQRSLGKNIIFCKREVLSMFALA